MSEAAQVDSHRGTRWAGYAPLDATASQQLSAALQDIAEGLRRWRSWSYLALETIKNQYRRTILGPWWLTLQTVAYVIGLAIIFSHILGTGLKAFLPYVALGFICFNLLSGLTRAAAATFVGASDRMRSTRQPLSSYVLRDVTIEFILFGHNLVIYVIFAACGLISLRPELPIALPIIALMAINGFFSGLWLGPTAARFRDVGPLVQSLLQVLVFFTPTFYRLNNLGSGSRRDLLDWNPFTYFLGAFRNPMIGAPLRLADYVGVIAVTLINVVLGLVVFSRTRSRLPYWVA
jgi:ABC-type polysaccharide/polyol phosphate export permease